MANKKYIVKDGEGNELEVTEVEEPAKNAETASEPFTEEQKAALQAMISAAIEEALNKMNAHDADTEKKEEKDLDKAVEQEEKPIVGDSVKEVTTAAAAGKTPVADSKVEDSQELIETAWQKRFSACK